MLGNKNKTQAAQKGGDYMTCNYNYQGQAQVHYFGGYISVSNELGDYLLAPTLLRQYRVTKNVQVQVGATQEIGKRVKIRERYDDGFPLDIDFNATALAQEEVITRPVYETKVVDATPPFKEYGRPIQVGDTVVIAMASLHRPVGRLVHLDDYGFALSLSDGIQYQPWSTFTHRLERA